MPRSRTGKWALQVALLAFAGSGLSAIGSRVLAGMPGVSSSGFETLFLAVAVVLAVVGILCVPAAIHHLRAADKTG